MTKRRTWLIEKGPAFIVSKSMFCVNRVQFKEKFFLSDDMQHCRELQELQEWLDSNCVHSVRASSLKVIVFESVDDATLFKMVFGGELSEWQ